MTMSPRSRRCGAICIAAVLMVLPSCARAGPASLTGDAVITAGNVGGVYVTIGQELAAAVPVHDGKASLVRTDGSVTNLNRLAAGTSDVGFSLADAAEAAFHGSGPWRAPLPVCALARLYDSYVQVVVLAGSDIRQVGDLRGRRISIGSAGSGSTLVANRILDAAGLVPGVDVNADNADLADSTAALADRRIDALIWIGGLPTTAITELAGRAPLALVDLRPVIATLDRRFGDVYRPSTVPASVYGTGTPVDTVSITNYLMAAGSISREDTTVWLRTLFTDRVSRSHPEAARLNPRTAVGTGTVPLCAGAVDYYRSQVPGSD